MLKVYFNFLPNRISTCNNILPYRREILVNSLKANRGKEGGRTARKCLRKRPKICKQCRRRRRRRRWQTNNDINI